MLIALIAAARVASTYAVFSETNDEPTHIAAGLQLLQGHRYDMLVADPPLPGLFFAAGPWMLGARLPLRTASKVPDAARMLYTAGNYPATLIAARAGNLVFLLIAVAATWACARAEAGNAAALVAALLLASEPLFLGHAGLATHDVPATAGVALSLFAFARWRAERDTGHAALAGAAYGFAVLCKLSCIVFVPVACAAILLIRRERPRLRDLAIAGAVAAHVVCVGYVFVIDRLFDSLALLSQMDRAGMLAYLHGELRTTGWWTYFPIAVGLKTTLPLLALALLAMFVPRARPYLAAAAAMLLVMTQSTLDIGARYALPLYVPLTVGAAMAVTSARSRLLRGAAIALLVAQTIVSARAHPDYIASFNALAGNEPSRWLIDSNLEWGQDAKRLGQTARALHIDRLKLSMMTQADLDTLGFPPHEEIDPAVETRGWIAVGEHKYRIRQAQRGGRLWLDGLPYQRIGKSIRLYHVP